MTLGERIRMARKTARLSGEELAERLAVSQASISRWELDEVRPSLDRLVEIHKAIGGDFPEAGVCRHDWINATLEFPFAGRTVERVPALYCLKCRLTKERL